MCVLIDRMQYRIDFDKIMKSENTKVNFLFGKIIFLGPPDRGKTVTRKRLLGEIINIGEEEFQQPSTEVVESHTFCIKDIHHTALWIEDKNWIVLNNDLDEGQLLMELCRKSLHSSSSVANSSRISEDVGMEHPITPEEVQHTSTTPQTPSIESTFTSSTDNNADNRRQIEVPRTNLSYSSATKYGVSSFRKDKKDIWKYFEKAIMDGNLGEIANDLENAALIYMHDTGGQPELMDMLPALTFGPALYFLFCKLTDDLNDKFTLCYRMDKGKSSMPVKSTATVKEYLLSVLSSIYCMGASTEEGNAEDNDLAENGVECASQKCSDDSQIKQVLKSSRAAVYIMGTHKDKLKVAATDDQVERKIEEFDKNLQKVFLDFYDKKIVRFSNERLIYPIDNKYGNQNDILELKKFVQSKVNTNFKKLPVPVRWLAFSLCLRNTGKKVVDLHSCISFGRLFGMNPDDTKLSLSFFHTQAGILMYYHGVQDLEEKVIIDTQIVYYSVTMLIVKILKLEEMERTPEADEVRKTGQFNCKCIDITCQNETLSLDILLILLKHLYVIAPLPHKKNWYLMPCLLNSLTSDELEEIKLEYYNDYASSLIIWFSSGVVPIGVFSSLITNLAQLDSKEVSN